MIALDTAPETHASPKRTTIIHSSSKFTTGWQSPIRISIQCKIIAIIIGVGPIHSCCGCWRNSIGLSSICKSRQVIIWVTYFFFCTIIGSISIRGICADVIGALLFPFGAFFIGYTISALLTGLTYGLLLHQKKEFKVDKKFIIHLVIATLIVTLLINGGLNTLWISIQYKKAFIALASTRIVKELIMIPVMILAMLGLGKEFEKEINVTRND